MSELQQMSIQTRPDQWTLRCWIWSQWEKFNDGLAGIVQTVACLKCCRYNSIYSCHSGQFIVINCYWNDVGACVPLLWRQQQQKIVQVKLTRNDELSFSVTIKLTCSLDYERFYFSFPFIRPIRFGHSFMCGGKLLNGSLTEFHGLNIPSLGNVDVGLNWFEPPYCMWWGLCGKQNPGHAWSILVELVNVSSTLYDTEHSHQSANTDRTRTDQMLDNQVIRTNRTCRIHLYFSLPSICYFPPFIFSCCVATTFICKYFLCFFFWREHMAHAKPKQIRFATKATTTRTVAREQEQ